MKRLIAFTLALVMMLSLAPSVFAADTGWEWARKPKTFVYEFNSYAHTGTNTSSASETNSFLATEQTIENAADGYQKWGFVNQRNDGSVPATQTNYMVLYPRNNGNGPVYDPGVAANDGYTFPTVWRSAYIFELDIEESGTYNPSLDYTTYAESPIIDIYLIEKPANGDTELNYYKNGGNNTSIQTYVWSLPSTARIGKSIDMQQAGTGVKKSAELLPVTLDADKNYYLIFIPVGITNNPSNSNDQSYVRMYLRSFTLNKKLPEDASLSYKLHYKSLNSNLPQNTASTETGSGGINGYNVYKTEYFDWNYTTNITAGTEPNTVVEGNEIYNTLDLTKTAPFKIDRDSDINKWYNVTNRKVDVAFFAQMTMKVDTSIKCEMTDVLYRPHLTLRLNVPYAGQYHIKVSKPATAINEQQVYSKVYFGKALDTYNTADINSKISSGAYKHIGWYNYNTGLYTADSTAEDMVSTEYFVVDIPVAGEYHLHFDTSGESIKMNPQTAIAAYPERIYQYFRLGQIDLIPVPGTLSEAEVKIQEITEKMTADIADEPTEAAPSSATVKIITRAIDGNADANTVEETLVGDVGSTFKATAPKKDNYEFLYWEKGIGNERRVVSDAPEYSFTAASGGTWLTAVYKSDSSDTVPVTFYNATGDEISKSKVNASEVIEMPEAPVFENYAFTGWKCAETGRLYAVGETITAEGAQMRLVAQYADTQTPNITVSVTGGTGAGTYTYGDTVKVSATERENRNGSKVFVYWTKDGEIVSFDKVYTFPAAQNCALVAVYEDYKPIVAEKLRRIMIKGNFAEFIGLEDASEKGILFKKEGGTVSFTNATHKITMTGKGAQLKFENDLGENSSMTGYAIVDGKVIYGK